MRKVMVATPTAVGVVHMRFASAMAQSVKACAAAGIDLLPVFVGNGPAETLRDDLLAMAVQSDVADLVWIDADIEWDPAWLPRLLGHPVDVVGGTYRQKRIDGEAYVLGGQLAALKPGDDGLIEVDHLGCGFLRLSRKAFLRLWSKGKPYRVRGIEGVAGERRRVFQWDTSGGERVSEDIGMCRQLRRAGLRIYLDPAMTCNHVGEVVFAGRFDQWLAGLQAAPALNRAARRKKKR